ncbi:MAG: hypothetical protein IKD86_00330 [Firmicutes bacterium]|nr:hypothetical protein [Bacillota bacterium]
MTGSIGNRVYVESGRSGIDGRPVLTGERPGRMIPVDKDKSIITGLEEEFNL